LLLPGTGELCLALLLPGVPDQRKEEQAGSHGEGDGHLAKRALPPLPLDFDPRAPAKSVRVQHIPDKVRSGVGPRHGQLLHKLLDPHEAVLPLTALWALR
jgi:hypothetical protein